MSAHTIKPDWTVEAVEPENGTDFQMEELQKLVGGDFELHTLRIMDVATPMGVRLLAMNEDARRLELPQNELGTALMRQSVFGTIVLLGMDQVR